MCIIGNLVHLAIVMGKVNKIRIWVVDEGPRCQTICFHHQYICDPLSQTEHKVATAAIQNYCRFKFFIMQALKWYMVCGYSSLFYPVQIIILCWFTFVFYCFVTCLTGYISVCKLATLRSFCGSRSLMLCNQSCDSSILTSHNQISQKQAVHKALCWIMLSFGGSLLL